jgi:hypothetical protein
LEYQFVTTSGREDLPVAIALDDQTLFEDKGGAVDAVFFLDAFTGRTLGISQDGKTLEGRPATLIQIDTDNDFTPFTVGNNREGTEAPVRVESIVTGFQTATKDEEGIIISRTVTANPENFLAAEVRPALATVKGREDVAKAHADKLIDDATFLSFFGIQASADQTVGDLVSKLREALNKPDPIGAIGAIDGLTEDQKRSATAELSRTIGSSLRPETS